ncbi:MAG: hypothetical protein DWH87_00060, partial [Planctomycetota bacterium]
MQPDAPTTAHWAYLLVFDGSSLVHPELLPKGHGAIGRCESPLKKRTPPLFCLVKKLADIASKEGFWNS